MGWSRTPACPRTRSPGDRSRRSSRYSTKGPPAARAVGPDVRLEEGEREPIALLRRRLQGQQAGLRQGGHGERPQPVHEAPVHPVYLAAQASAGDESRLTADLLRWILRHPDPHDHAGVVGASPRHVERREPHDRELGQPGPPLLELGRVIPISRFDRELPGEVLRGHGLVSGNGELAHFRAETRLHPDHDVGAIGGGVHQRVRLRGRRGVPTVAEPACGPLGDPAPLAFTETATHLALRPHELVPFLLQVGVDRRRTAVAGDEPDVA